MALSSMTGFGRARRTRGALTVLAEARSVNGRHLAVRCRLPAELVRLEGRLEALVRGRASRGSVDLSVRLERSRADTAPRIDRKLLATYRRAAGDLGSGGGAALLALPGVIRFSDAELPERTTEGLVLDAAGGALDALQAARAAEGGRLTAALRRQVTELMRHVAALRRAAPAAVAARQAALRERVAALLAGVPGGLPADDPGLRRELALLADRHDITEELDRLESHGVALRAALDADEPVGRQLDFLLQEVGREVNTIGSKAGAAALVERVVTMKSVVERLREQAANVE